MNKYIFSAAFLLSGLQLNAQNNLDADAIKADDPRISGWATACTIERGWLDIADKSMGLASVGSEQNAVGPVSNAVTVLSLGDSGIAVLTFDQAIKNVEGPDFAVFENGFLDPIDSSKAFLELAFVEVSSDGTNFVRFPASYTGQDTAQIGNFTYSRGQDYHNLAGRYINGYGTPFDLEELKDFPGLDVNNITHVRIVDVIGSLDPSLGSKDATGNMINDPYPTAFASSGFDLTGVAVLNAIPNSMRDLNSSTLITLSPNPAQENLKIIVNGYQQFNYQFVNVAGQVLQEGKALSGSSIDVSKMSSGIYYSILQYAGKKSMIKFVKQ